MNKKYTFFIFPFCIALFVLQSCWKDESLKDKGFDDISVNISPSFGIPLANLTLTGDDIVKQLNISDSSKTFYIEYGSDGLCYIVYDKTNLQISLPPVLSFDTTLTFPIDYFFDLRLDGVEVKQVLVNLNIDNGYTNDITFNVYKFDYEDENGVTKQVTSSSLANTNLIKAAPVDGKFTRTQLFNTFLAIGDPIDIINKGSHFRLGLDLSYSLLQNSSHLNLNPEVRVPAWFSVENFLRMDTVSANLKGISDIFNDTTISLKDITLYLTAKNGFPLEADLQVYFVDDNYRIIDSLQSPQIQIPPGQINPSTYLLTSPTITSFEITMSGERFKRIEKSKYLIFKEIFRTGNGRDVKLFRSNTLGITLSAKVKAEINGSISNLTK